MTGFLRFSPTLKTLVACCFVQVLLAPENIFGMLTSVLMFLVYVDFAKPPLCSMG